MIQIPIASRLIGRLHALAKDRRANVAVELALAMPALCMFIFGIIEVGYALWMQNALDYSVATAARCASLTNPNINASTSPCSGRSPCPRARTCISGSSTCPCPENWQGQIPSMA